MDDKLIFIDRQAHLGQQLSSWQTTAPHFAGVGNFMKIDKPYEAFVVGTVFYAKQASHSLVRAMSGQQMNALRSFHAARQNPRNHIALTSIDLKKRGAQSSPFT